MNNMNNDNEILGWDDEISQESNFTLFEPGTYPFTVINFERAAHQPNPNKPGKVPAGTPKAVVTMLFKAPDGSETQITENLFMLKRMEWKISEFFIAIGLKKKGEKVNMNWQKVLGAQGKAELTVNNYTAQDGNQGQNNRIKKFLEPTEAVAQTAYQAPQQNYQAPVQQAPQSPFPPNTGGGYNF